MCQWGRQASGDSGTNPHRGVMGGGIPMAGGAANIAAGKLGVNANGFGGGLGGSERHSALPHPTISMHMEWD